MSYAHILGTIYEYSSCVIFLSCMIDVDHGLTLEEDMYERPCIVDDSKNSLRISILKI